jgi:hypothetical protein
MFKSTLLPLYAFILSTSFLVPSMAEARRSSEIVAGQVTEYYTMVNKKVKPYDCRMEGNQIVHGQLWGSDCKPYKRKYGKWGVGAGNRCLTPCVSAAGSKRLVGRTVRLPHPMMCKWGPYKGYKIYEVKIADVGGAVQGSHVDVFMGLCNRTISGVCHDNDYVKDDSMIAEYNGHTRESEMAEASDDTQTQEAEISGATATN